MRLSRNIVLLLCAVVVTITSIGMNSFSLFLKPIEAGFGWSRTMVTVPYAFAMLGWSVGRLAPLGGRCLQASRSTSRVAMMVSWSSWA
jgi:hypothetical protein